MNCGHKDFAELTTTSDLDRSALVAILSRQDEATLALAELRKDLLQDRLERNSRTLGE